MELRELGPQDLDLLFYHLLRCQDVLTAALSRVTLEHFNPVAERHFKLLWAIVADYYKQHQALLSESAIVAEVQHRARLNSMEIDATVVRATYDKIQLYYRGWNGQPFVIPYVLELLNGFIFHRQYKDRMTQAISGPVVQEGMLAELLRDYRSRQVTHGNVLEPFTGTTNWLETEPRQPCGVIFLDLMLNGGMRPKEAYGFIAPVGGGKTTLSNQLAISQAKRGRHIYVFSYEQPLDPDYFTPVYACAMRVSKDVLAKYRKPDDMPKELRDKWEEARAAIQHYLHFVDMSGCTEIPAGSGGVDELESMLNGFAGQTPVHGFVVDWFWEMIGKCAASRGVEDTGIRNFAQGELSRLKMLAGKLGCWCWINQQLEAAKGHRRQVQSWNAAAELKSFANNLNFCFVMGALDTQQIAEIKSAKARGARVTQKVVRLIGDQATFVPLGDDMIMDERTGQYTERQSLNKVPAPNELPAAPPSAEAGPGEGGLQV